MIKIWEHQRIMETQNVLKDSFKLKTRLNLRMFQVDEFISFTCIL